jgi:hypothetical protein
MEIRDVALAPGDYMGRVRLRPSGGTPLTEMIAFTVPAKAEALVGQPLFRRAASGTAAAFVPTARPIFRRTERLRIEVPVAVSADAARIELLDRTGSPMALAIDASVRPDDGISWVVGELTLAPLGAGDYVLRATIESAGRRHEAITAFRVER